MGKADCDQCNKEAVTQVNYGMGYGLYCEEHGALAEAARMQRIRRQMARR